MIGPELAEKVGVFQQPSASGETPFFTVVPTNRLSLANSGSISFVLLAEVSDSSPERSKMLLNDQKRAH